MRFLIPLLLFHWYASVFSQTSDSLSLFENEQVVLTGTRQAVPRTKLGKSITVIGRDQIQRNLGFNVLASLEQYVPGLFLGQQNVVGYGVGPNSGGTLSIRGLSGSPNSRVLLLIDGQPQYMGLFGHPIADAYMSEMVERVEVLRGGASMLYGAHAMGGAINLITRNPQPGLGGGARFSYGSFGTAQMNTHASLVRGKWQVFSSFDHQRTEGHRSDAADSFHSNNGYLKASYQISPHWRVQADGNLTDASYAFPGPDSMPLESENLRTYQRSRLALGITNQHKLWKGAFRAYHNGGRHGFDDGFRSTDFVQGISFYQTFQRKAATAWTLGIDGQRIGGQADHSQLPPQLTVGFGQAYRMLEGSMYAMLNQQIHPQIQAELGLRRNQHNQYGGQWMPSLSAVWAVRSDVQLRGLASRAYRNPTIRDWFLFIPANEALRPEQSWTTEIGLSQQWRGKPSSEIRLSWELTAFRVSGRDLIQEIFLPPAPPQRQNVAEFVHLGVETQLGLRFPKGFQAHSTYTFLQASTPLLFAPRHDWGTTLTYQEGRWMIEAESQWISGLSHALSPRQETTYFLLHTRLSARLLPGISVFAVGRNLLDKQYAIQTGFPLPGIQLEAGVRLSGRRRWEDR